MSKMYTIRYDGKWISHANRWWTPLNKNSSIDNPMLTFQVREARLYPSYRFLSIILRRNTEALIHAVTTGVINKTTNISNMTGYVPCELLLKILENLEIIQIDIIPGEISTIKAMPMTMFKTLEKTIKKLRKTLKEAELIQ